MYVKNSGKQSKINIQPNNLSSSDLALELKWVELEQRLFQLENREPLVIQEPPVMQEQALANFSEFEQKLQALNTRIAEIDVDRQVDFNTLSVNMDHLRRDLGVCDESLSLNRQLIEAHLLENENLLFEKKMNDICKWVEQINESANKSMIVANEARDALANKEPLEHHKQVKLDGRFSKLEKQLADMSEHILALEADNRVLSHELSKLPSHVIKKSFFQRLKDLFVP